MQLLAALGLAFSGLLFGHSGAEAPVSSDKSNSFFASNHGGTRTISHVSSAPLVVIPIHVASHFPFVTINKDDGKDEAGGWQEATAKLPFGRIYPWGYSLWYCDINIGMPIRHSTKGYISPATAASESAKVTNSATRSMDFDLPQGIFCERFRPAVLKAFETMYPVSARVRKP